LRSARSPELLTRCCASGLRWEHSPQTPITAMSPFALIYGCGLVTSAACQTPGRLEDQRHGIQCMAGWHWQKFWSQFAFVV